MLTTPTTKGSPLGGATVEGGAVVGAVVSLGTVVSVGAVLAGAAVVAGGAVVETASSAGSVQATASRPIATTPVTAANLRRVTTTPPTFRAPPGTRHTVAADGHPGFVRMCDENRGSDVALLC